jgi:predicted DCC family thiol-disulfide oxidoreductase YuxK
MPYTVIYDGNCNLCVTLVQLLEKLDQGQQFQYVPMQDHAALSQWGITAAACEMGIILLKPELPEQLWQGSEAAEEIGRLLPLGKVFIDAYRSLPGVKDVGDRAYELIRDNRYTLFGKRSSTYTSSYPVCAEDHCQLS